MNKMKISIALMIIGVAFAFVLIYLNATVGKPIEGIEIAAAAAGLIFASGAALLFYTKYSSSDADGEDYPKTLSVNEAPEENATASTESLSFEEELRLRKQKYYSGANGPVVERHEASRMPVSASIQKQALPAKPDSGKIKIVLPFGRKKNDPLRDLLDVEEKSVKEVKPWRSS